MKILQVINSFEGGGAEKLTLQLHQMYLQQGIDSHAVSLMQSSAGDLPNTHSLDFNSPYKISVLFKLYLFLNQPQWKNLDIIHVHLFPAQFFTPLLTKILGIKAILVTTEHSTDNSRRRNIFGKIIDYIFYRFYAKVVCISDGTLFALRDWQFQISDKLVIIYNGINLYEFLPTCIVKSKPNTSIIVSVGRLVENKNYESAIRALSKIAEQPFEYWIVGSGSQEFHLRQLAKALNLESKIKFLGFRNDISDILSQADIFLQTSLWEGFGLAVVEAMAAGLPVVVSNVPGVREVVTDESEAGFFVDPTSENDIADKLSKLINNQNLRLTMGKNAQIQAIKFDINQTVQEYLNLYRSICKSKI